MTTRDVLRQALDLLGTLYMSKDKTVDQAAWEELFLEKSEGAIVALMEEIKRLRALLKQDEGEKQP